MQQHAVWFTLLQNHSTYFGCPQHPSSGILKTVTAASGTGHNIGTVTSLHRGLIRSLYMFRVSQHLSSGVLKTVTAASGTGHNIGTVTSLQRGLIRSLYMFRVSQHPSSGVLKTVTTASGTGHNVGTVTSLNRGQVPTRPRWRDNYIYCLRSLIIRNIFCAFFHTGLSPTIELGSTWPPTGIQPFSPTQVPLLNRCLVARSRPGHVGGK